MRTGCFITLLSIVLISCVSENNTVHDSDVREHEVSLSLTAASLDSVYTPENPSSVSEIHSPTVRISKPLEWKEVLNNSLTVASYQISTAGDPIASIQSALSPERKEAVINPVYALDPEVVEVKYFYLKDYNPHNFANIRIQEGLRHNQIRAVIQDHAGNLWLATDDGLSRYDGKFLYHYTTDHRLSNNLIINLFQDSNNNLWIGTFRGGVTKFDGRRFTTFTTDEGLSDNVVNAITEDNNGNIWIATGNGISKFDGKIFTNYRKEDGLPVNDTRDIIFDNQNNIVIATYGGGISFFKNEKFLSYNTTNGLNGDYILSLTEDSENNIWIGTSNKGLSKFNGSNFRHFSEDNSFPDDNTRDVYADSRGNIWIATAQAGVVKYNGNTFTVFGNKEGLPSQYIRCVLEDRNGTIWLGTRGAGLSKYNGSLFTHYTIRDGLSENRVMNIFTDKNITWLGTYGNYITLLKQDSVKGKIKKFISYFNAKQGLHGTRVYKIFKQSNGNMWFGTDGGGVTIFDGKKTYTYTTSQGLAEDAVRDIEEDKEGNIWVATYGKGISIFDGETFKTIDIDNGLPVNNIMSLHKDLSGNMWVGTDGGGLLKISDNNKFTLYSPKKGFPATAVYSIEEEKDGTLWFGTAGQGLIRFDGKIFNIYDIKSGLNSNYVLSLKKDPHGNLWIGTRSGINIINKNQLTSIDINNTSPAFNSYGFEEGFSGISCNFGALSHDNMGNAWIGTETMLTSFNPSYLEEKKVSADPVITDVKLHYSGIPWHLFRENPDTSIILKNGLSVSNVSYDSISRWYNLPIKLILNHRNNYISFNFSAINHIQNKRILYQYKLQGMDQRWNSPTYRNEASYGNLKHGNYIFKLKAVTSSGIWSNEVEFPFTIRPPWYKTASFYIFCILSLIGMIFLYTKQRLKRITKEKTKLKLLVHRQTAELKQKNKDLENSNLEKDKFFSIIAHDLKGPFNGFFGLTQIMSESIEELSKEEIKDIASSLKTSATNLYSLLENLLQWSSMKRSSMPFNPQPLNISEIVNKHISSLTDEAETKNIIVNMDIETNHTIYADTNMFLAIIRNLISNAIKFTPKNGRVTIKTEEINNFIQISIQDTGIGMNKEILNNLFMLNMISKRSGTDGEPSTGLGLVISKEFTEKHGGKLWAESKENQGSVFHFIMPLAK